MRAARSERGAVFVEFLIVFLPLLALIMCMIQLALIYAGKLVTQHAADTAVRAAVVVLDDDPRYYGGAARDTAAGPRLADIKRAAVVPLASLSSYGGTVERAVGLGEAGLSDALAAADAATQLRFPRGAHVGLESDVTVEVDYDFHCGVPLARWILCAAGGGRSIQLRASATLPNQGAPYAY